MTDVHKAILVHLPRNKKIDIEFQNIKYTVHERKRKKQVLKSISGTFKSGELTAIMGPSGAGKSSLLNVLTGFQTSGVQGTIKTNSYQQDETGATQYRKDCCYILQDDQLFPLFSVLEIMSMAADLKLGYGLSKKAKIILIEDILDALGLLSCKETRCGRLSGGQKKRLSIALELIDNPPIMFLDEPTSGLDSSSSFQCITMLKSLARGGRTIVCTIHQPSATIFQMFDHVYVLANGQNIYQGASTSVIPYLSAVGLNCPQYHNPADYLLEVANGEYGQFTENLSKAAEETSWRNQLPSSAMAPNEKKSNRIDDDNGKTLVLIRPPSEWARFWILLNRSYLQMYRDWTMVSLKLVIHIVIGAFLGFFFLDFGNDGSKTISNLSFCLISPVYLAYTSMMPAILKFPAEVPVLRKENFNNWYKLRTYYAAFLVSNVPQHVVFSVAYSSIAYYLAAQPPEMWRFCMFMSICSLVAVIAESTGIVLGTIVDPINGTFLGAISLAVMLCFGGYLILFTHMSDTMLLISNISYIAFAFESLVQSIYGYGRDAIPCPEDVSYCLFRSSETVLQEMGMVEMHFWKNFMYLCANIVVLKIIGFCTLKRKLASS